MYQVPLQHSHRHQIPLLWIASALVLVNTICDVGILVILWKAWRAVQ